MTQEDKKLINRSCDMMVRLTDRIWDRNKGCIYAENCEIIKNDTCDNCSKNRLSDSQEKAIEDIRHRIMVFTRKYIDISEDNITGTCAATQDFLDSAIQHAEDVLNSES